MSIPESKIKRAWITAGQGKLWGTKGTYSSVAYEQLPSLPPVAPSFAWMESVPDRNYGCTLDSDDNKLGSLFAIEAELKKLGFQLPEEFSTFIRDRNLQRRIPSCTACVLDLSNAVTELPGFPGSYGVRFMNDSQCCILWYLLFQPLLPVRILATACFIERDIFKAMEYMTEEDRLLEYGEVLKDSCICAESFGEFICRFGLENMIWYATHDGQSLSPIEQRYLVRAQKAERGAGRVAS